MDQHDGVAIPRLSRASADLANCLLVPKGLKTRAIEDGGGDASGSNGRRNVASSCLLIHVLDLAAGHVAALRLLDSPKCFAVSLGTGARSSVLEVVRAFEKVSGTPIPYDIKPRRPGDIAAYYAATAYASELMGWKATRTLETMCADHWRWQSTNPNGYA